MDELQKKTRVNQEDMEHRTWMSPTWERVKVILRIIGKGNLRVTGGPATPHEVLEEMGSGQWGQDRCVKKRVLTYLLCLSLSLGNRDNWQRVWE